MILRAPNFATVSTTVSSALAFLTIIFLFFFADYPTLLHGTLLPRRSCSYHLHNSIQRLPPSFQKTLQLPSLGLTRFGRPSPFTINLDRLPTTIQIYCTPGCLLDEHKRKDTVFLRRTFTAKIHHHLQYHDLLIDGDVNLSLYPLRPPTPLRLFYKHDRNYTLIPKSRSKSTAQHRSNSTSYQSGTC